MSILSVTVYAICWIYLILNFKFDIQMLQQNSYRINRYWKWICKGDDSTWRMVDIAVIFILLSTLVNSTVSLLIAGIVSIVKIGLILKRKYKKPLVFTKRVWRIYFLTGFLASILYGLSIFTFLKWPELAGFYDKYVIPVCFLFLITAVSFLIVIAAVWLLIPVENSINSKYEKEAKDILSSMPDLKIIGITGSYGKTSTKHYLSRILSEKYDVLMTPGSYNTPMGVIRTVREMMKPYNEVFICEMGAKQKGDIKEICDLVNPRYGIITAVGPMHLESFKTIENVQSTKFELADALSSDGFIVVNNDFEYCANRNVSNTKIFRYGVENTHNCDFVASDIDYSPEGTKFVIKDKDGNEMTFETRLLGECNISNLMASVIVALQLGLSVEKIQYAIRSIEQVEHRLNVKQTAGGVNIIDDAFNSNPSGSKMAVEVLSHFKDGKRIIVTPGMIELGSQQEKLNEEFGVNIAKNVDIAIIVGHYNRDSILKGLHSASFPDDNIYIVDTFNEAQAELSRLLKSGDTVLYENDLPDTFK